MASPFLLQAEVGGNHRQRRNRKQCFIELEEGAEPGWLGALAAVLLLLLTVSCFLK